MIYITGDTHIPADIQKLNRKLFPEQRNLTKEDYVIICGDFGGVWDGSNEEKYWIKWLKNKSFTTLFIDGNHENFERLNNLSSVEFCGGIAHRVDEGIYHLMRGQVYNICQKKIFTFGGASSHDRHLRKEGKSWWAEEMPSDEEYRTAVRNLEANNWQVDYVLTHCTGTSLQNRLFPEYEKNILTDFFDKLEDKLSFKMWCFGHYHKDINIDNYHLAIFNNLQKLS